MAGAGRTLGRHPLSRRRARSGLGFVAPFVVMFVLFLVVPIGYSIYQSFIGVERSGPLGLGETTSVFVGFDNYVRALSDGNFIGSFRRVVLFGLVQVPIMIALATTLALLLDSASARGVRFFRASYFMPYGVPGVIASILWGFMYVPGISPLVDVLGAVGIDVNFLDRSTAMWSIGNILVWQFAGYNMLVIVAQLHSVNREIYESARVDGATGWQVVRHIKLPLIRPALVLTTVFSIIGTIQMFAEPEVLRPISTGITSNYTPNMNAFSQAFDNNNYGLAAAQAVIIAAVACVLAFTFLGVANRRGRRR